MFKRIRDSIADYFRETDKILLLLCIAASCYGAVIVLSATYVSSGYSKFFVQLMGIALGVVGALILSLFQYQTFLKYWYVIAGIAVGLVILTFFIGYAPAGTDDKAWIALPFGLTFQPSELLKIAFTITFTRHVCAVSEQDIRKFRNVLLLCIHGAIPVLLIHMQGEDGSAMVLAFIFLSMFFAAGIPVRYFAIAGGLVVPAAAAMWFFVLNSSQKERVLALIYPERYAAIVYQQLRGQTAIGSGGLFGYGLFQGPYVQGGKIPLGYNDFIFASCGEELGFLGCMAILILLFAICLRILWVGRHSGDRAGRILCAGIFGMIASQSIINIGMCLFLLPVIGITLPFFSAGGTSLTCLLLGIGVVLSVHKNRNRRVLSLHDSP